MTDDALLPQQRDTAPATVEEGPAPALECAKQGATGSMRDAPPAVRAVELARGLRATFVLDVGDITYLLRRWASVAAVDIGDTALELVSAMVVADDQRPLTAHEARRIAQSAAQDFSDLQTARIESRRFAQLIGADTAQCSRLDVLVRETWHRRGAEPQERAA